VVWNTVHLHACLRRLRAEEYPVDDADLPFLAVCRGLHILNVARGGLVQTSALVEALEKKHLAGAGLDVTDPEPLPEWEAPPAQAPVSPSRAYSKGSQTAPQRAHTPGGSAPDVTRQKPATREFEEYPEPSAPSSPSGRKSRVGLKRPSSNGVNGHARLEEDVEPSTELPAPRRTSSSAGKLRRTATGLQRIVFASAEGLLSLGHEC